MRQLTIDFQPNPIVNGKKLAKLTIPCSDDFLDFIDKLAKLHGMPRAPFAHRLVLEGMQRYLGSAFMAEPHLDKRLDELLS